MMVVINNLCKTLMTENMIWKNTSRRFVGFFDIMGFKDLVYRNSHESVLIKMNRLNQIIVPIEQESKRLLTQTEKDAENYLKEFESLKERSKENLMKDITVNRKDKEKYLRIIARPVMFSDSIMIVTSGDTFYDAQKITIVSSHLIKECFANGIPIKGAISCGIMTADFEKSIYFGQPLIDAYLLQEELLLYGVILDNKTEAVLEKHNIQENFARWLTYKTPLKSGLVNHMLLNWHFKRAEHEGSLKQLKNFYKSVCGRPRIYIDNTINFINYIDEVAERYSHNKSL